MFVKKCNDPFVNYDLLHNKITIAMIGSVNIFLDLRSLKKKKIWASHQNTLEKLLNVIKKNGNDNTATERR